MLPSHYVGLRSLKVDSVSTLIRFCFPLLATKYSQSIVFVYLIRNALLSSTIAFYIQQLGCNMVDISPRYGGNHIVNSLTWIWLQICIFVHAPNSIGFFKQTGHIMGLSNTLASFAGILGNLFTGIILDTTHSWSIVFIVMICIYIFGTIVYLRYAKGEIVFE